VSLKCIGLNRCEVCGLWVLIGEREAKWREQTVGNDRDGHKATPLLRLEALEFLERAIWIRARSIMKCLEWSVKNELEVAS
jgi:hypothetical protein